MSDVDEMLRESSLVPQLPELFRHFFRIGQGLIKPRQFQISHHPAIHGSGNFQLVANFSKKLQRALEIFEAQEIIIDEEQSVTFGAQCRRLQPRILQVECDRKRPLRKLQCFFRTDCQEVLRAGQSAFKEILR